jgi:small subunit ribosomal protein S21
MTKNNHYVKRNDSDRYAKSGMTVEVKNGNFEKAFRRFKKKCTEEGLVQEIRTRKEFVKPSEVKRKAKDAGRKRWQKIKRQQDNT